MFDREVFDDKSGLHKGEMTEWPIVQRWKCCVRAMALKV
jgi:hypothetical protein